MLDRDIDGRDEIHVAQADEGGFISWYNYPRRGPLDAEGVFQPIPSLWRENTAHDAQYDLDETVDLNGDGLPERVYIRQQDARINVRIGASPNFANTWQPQASLNLVSGPGPVDLTSADLDRNGSQDLVIANKRGGSVSLWRMPGPARWTTHLRDPLRRETTVGRGEQNTLIYTAPHQVTRITLRARIDGKNLHALNPTLYKPGLEPMELGFGPRSEVPGADQTWHLIRDDLLEEMEYETGHLSVWPWVFRPLVGGPDADAVEANLTDVTIVTEGAFFQEWPGRSAERPALVRMAEGVRARRLRRTTVGGLGQLALSCGDTGGEENPERWFEIPRGDAQRVSVGVFATHRLGVEVREGPCDADGAVLYCDSGAVGLFRPDIGLTAETLCVIVDGDGSVGRGQSGPFDLQVTYDVPPTATCEPDCEVEQPDRNGTVFCEGDRCVIGAGEACCISEQRVCSADPCEGFLTATARCDGPEDCGGQRCCAVFANLEAACAPECGAGDFDLCHDDNDCGDGQTCQSCRVPLLDATRMCVGEGGCPDL